jgi:GMP synthase (glutamine-hydrolysing)
MKKIRILKTGKTFSSIYVQHGDFDDWIIDRMEINPEKISVTDVFLDFPLPKAEECAGVVITGSHSMVTDNHDWSLKLEKWLPGILQSGIPLLGICYGHQLLARAAGGIVGYHPQGPEVGTVDIQNIREKDILFNSLPKSFQAHAVHSQTVLKLPPQAVRLASSKHDDNHAFRLGKNAWGVQFHPEFSVPVMKAYMEEHKSNGHSVKEGEKLILDSVKNTPLSSSLLKRFGQITGI